MPRAFSPATAEQVLSAVEAVVVHGNSATVDFVAEFLDVTQNQAKAALSLATDIGFLAEGNDHSYSTLSPLCRLVSSPNQNHKAALLRILLESYEPFLRFRERLSATELASTAAQQTKVSLGLSAHREEVKDTLISLGTFTQSLLTEPGGRYTPSNAPLSNALAHLAQTCADVASAEQTVRVQLGVESTQLVSRDEVILPLAEALLVAKAGDGRGAVVRAGNAFESFLNELARPIGVNLTGANGINSKLEKFGPGNKLPKKLIGAARYIGHIRNAADHGTDPDHSASWTIRNETGLEFVYVACSIISAAVAYHRRQTLEI